MPEEYRCETGPGTWQVVGLHHVAFAHGTTARPRRRPLRPPRTACRTRRPRRGSSSVCSRPGMASCNARGNGRGRSPRFLDRRGPACTTSRSRSTASMRRVATCAARRAAGGREPRPGGMGTRIAFVHPAAFGGCSWNWWSRRPGRGLDRLIRRWKGPRGRIEAGPSRRRRKAARSSAGGTTGARSPTGSTRRSRRDHRSPAEARASRCARRRWPSSSA